MVEMLLHRYANLLIRRRIAFFVLFVTASAAVAAGALHLEVDFSARAFFGSDTPATAALDRFQKTFGPDDNIIMAVVSAKNDHLITPERLEHLHHLAEAFSRIDGVTRVLGPTELPLPSVDAIGMLSFAPVDRKVPTEPLKLAAFRARLAKERPLTPVLLSADQKHAAILIAFGDGRVPHEGAVDPDDIGAVRHLVARIAEMAEAGQKSLRERGDDGLEVRLTGTPVIRAALLELVLHDQTVFVPFAFSLMAFLLMLLYRRFYGVLLPLVAAALPAGLVMGVMGYVGEPIGVVNQVYFTLLPVIAVAGSIHILSRYYFEAHHLGIDANTLMPQHRGEAIRRAIERAGGPCFFSALTTIVGLLSLQASGMPILRSFGLYSSIGVAFAFVGTVVLLPIVLSATRGRTLRGPAGEGGSLDKVLGWCADVSLRHRWPMIIGGLVLAGTATWLSSAMVVDNSLTGLLGPKHAPTQAGRIVDTNLGGLSIIEVHLSGPPRTLDEPAVLAAVQNMERWAETQPEVRAVVGPAGIVGRVHQVLTGDDDKNALPDEKNAAAQLWFLTEGHPLRVDLITGDRSEGRIQLYTPDLGALTAVELAERVTAEMSKMIPEGSELGLVVTGTTLTSALGINHLSIDMRTSIFWAYLIIILVIFAIFRSVRLGVVAVLLNGIPLICGSALLVLLGWNLEPGPAVVFTVALGIAVDDTIHIVSRYRENVGSLGQTQDQAIRFAVVRSGRPVAVTTVILAAGFLVHVLSEFPTNLRVGVLGAFVIVAALVANLFLLPPLMSLLLGADGSDAGRGSKDEASGETADGPVAGAEKR